MLFAFPPGFMAFRPVGASFRFGMSVRPSVSVPSFPQSARSPCFQPTVGIPLFSCFACLHLNIYEDVSFRAPLFVPPAPIGLSFLSPCRLCRLFFLHFAVFRPLSSVSFLSTSFHSEKKVFPQCVRCFLLLNTCFTACFLSMWLCLCVLVSGLSRKKVGKTFGVYVKRLYLCTRFREARPCVAAADRGR